MLPERTVVVATLDRTLNLDLILTPKPNSKPQHWQKPHVNGCIAIDQVSLAPILQVRKFVDKPRRDLYEFHR